jgi:putative DNA primase/helicase
MSWSNYDDVLAQLRSLGLVVDRLEVGYNPHGKPWRCKVEGGGVEKRGWYILHELRLDSGDTVLVGSFGSYRGAEANAQKVELKKTQLSADQKTALRERIKQDQRVAEAERKRVAERAGERARSAWEKCATDGAPPYLQRKGIAAHGTRVSPAAAVVVPMLDTAGRIHGLQFIHAQKRGGRDKDFWPPGCAKQGHFFQLGPVPSTVLLIAEGYATAASLFEASGYPVAVAFDAGNLQPVAQALARRYPKARILVCADDDYLTDGNPGYTKAAAAALAVDGAWFGPTFAADRAGKKLTDFNDLHALEGLQQVRVQVEAKLRLQQWLGTLQPAAHTRGAGVAADDGSLRKIQTPAELHDRYALVYGMQGACFDRHEHLLVAAADVRALCAGAWVSREWMGSPDADVVRQSEVGFDPAGTDPTIKCNLFGGWPTEPKEGDCSQLLDLLHYLCSAERNGDEVYQWTLKWLAYPLQHPGAKMTTALVFHGGQGTGKNMFFEAYMAIYGQHGRIIDQAAVEDKFNDCFSRKLFIIADEVVARSELYHVKNKLKGVITGEWIRINPKNMGAYDERNHVNVVFLSNEKMPTALEKDDRRYLVVWTPPKLDIAFYEATRVEIQSGGIAALHHHLLQLDLKDFKPWSPPPMTEGKEHLIDLGLDNTDRFYTEWLERLLPLPVCAARTQDLYDAYKHWCNRNGVAKPAQLSTFVGSCIKQPGASRGRRRHWEDETLTRDAQSMIFAPPDVSIDTGRDALSKDLHNFADSVNKWRDLRGQVRGVA